MTKMLVPAPYKAPKKKAKKEAKETKGGLRRKGTSDMVSEDIEAHSYAEEDEGEDEEEEESQSPLRGGERRGRPPHVWRPERLRRGKFPFQTNPPQPPSAAQSGNPGSSPWPNHEYKETRTHSYITSHFCIALMY